MEKYVRLFIKQEKRIIKLLWQKGLLQEQVKPEDLYWAYYTHGKRQRRRGGKKYAFHQYLPEVYYWTCDYWGECDEHGLVRSIIDTLYGENTSGQWDGSSSWPPSTFKYRGRKWFIKYLKALPTVTKSNKINPVLRRNKEQ